ncbi:histidine kinase dimerization/phospho-acceptor domain-containing protein [Sphingorhabdus sp.]|uniref:histidine kinase dimerization/phospho-acceptor domain-containing protein n=1 Tax=Sphingorhabdus sp. TaxID=1902408 RepID=UPI00391D3955
MRFDDRLETTLRQTDDEGLGLSAKWQQLVDILAQNPVDFDPQSVAIGLQKVRQFMDIVPAEVREQCVRALAGRLRSAPLLLLLSGDIPAVASAAINGARLSDQEWAEIVPQLSTRARGFLRNRRDMGPLTSRALVLWSSADFVLSKDVEETESIAANRQSVQIRDIVERIERLRFERENSEPAEAAREPVALDMGAAPVEIPALDLPEAEQVAPDELEIDINPIDEIRFEADEYGTICWVEGAPLGAIVGVDIAEPAFDDGPGPDAYGAAAFRQKMPLENARMRLCGAPAIAGDWRINASPFFDGVSGRFNGYRGILRRPNLSEVALIPESHANEAEHIQQLLHELRTPLGAIIGFSEIIEQQLFGPVTEDYRILAGNILHDAERLLSGFDDLSTAATIETGTYLAEAGVTECDWLSQRLAERLHGLTDLLQVTLNLMHAHPVRPFAIDHQLSERLFSRLLSAVIIGCAPGEVLDGRFRTEPGLNATNRFVLTLPKKLIEMQESELFGSGPGSIDDNDEAPLLGLGFSLRLVRSLARSVGGDLRFSNQSLIVSVPAVNDSRAGFRDEERE